VSTAIADGSNSASAEVIGQLGAGDKPAFETLVTTHQSRKAMNMLWTVAVILLVLWALGFATSYTMGGFIHLLLILAVVAVVIRLIQGRRAIP